MYSATHSQLSLHQQFVWLSWSPPLPPSIWVSRQETMFQLQLQAVIKLPVCDFWVTNCDRLLSEAFDTWDPLALDLSCPQDLTVQQQYYSLVIRENLENNESAVKSSLKYHKWPFTLWSAAYAMWLSTPWNISSCCSRLKSLYGASHATGAVYQDLT